MSMRRNHVAPTLTRRHFTSCARWERSKNRADQYGKPIFNLLTKARFHVTVTTQINKSVVYFIIRRNVKIWLFRMLISVVNST